MSEKGNLEDIYNEAKKVEEAKVQQQQQKK